ncbi:MAG: 5'-methylthioadenosine/S-adenosylhomocysteine nucleosidase [Verrucomicrobiota bacterium]
MMTSFKSIRSALYGLVFSAAYFLLNTTSSSGRNIGFLYALEKDFDALKTHSSSQPITHRIGHRKIIQFDLFGHRIYAVKMRSGIAASAISTEALLARFKMDLVFSTGVAGGIGPDISTGQWTEVTSVIAYQKGQFSEAGFTVSPSSTFAWSSLRESDFRPPAAWREVARTTAASGEAFIASNSKRKELHDTFEAEIVEMNLFGVVAACENHQRPHYHFRIISDFADEKAAATFKRFVDAYRGEGGNHLAELIRGLPPDTTNPLAYPNLKELLSPPSSKEPGSTPEPASGETPEKKTLIERKRHALR